LIEAIETLPTSLPLSALNCQRLCPDCGANLLCHSRQLIAVIADVGYLVFDDQMVLGVDCGFL
jgi:hypothetical protein